MRVEKFLEKLKKLLPEGSFLVGGTVRDLLMGFEPADIDILVPLEPQEVANKIAAVFGGTLFGFKKDNLPVRDRVYSVVMPGGLRVDISSYEDLYEDLSHRDFTVNAMALSVDGKSLVDPFGGEEDLKLRRLRMVSENSLREDPLRLLRLARLGASLGFSPEGKTLRVVRKLSKLLPTAAGERIVLELLKGAGGNHFPRFVSLLRETSLDEVIFGNPVGGYVVPQLEKFEGFLKNYRGSRAFLGGYPEEVALRYAFLLERLPGREKFLKSLPFGEEFSSFIKGLWGALRELREKSFETVSEKASFLERYGNYLDALRPLAAFEGLEEKLGKLREFYEKKFKPHKKPLLSGREVMEILNLKPSPEVGRVLKLLVKKQLEGKLTSKEEAVKFLKTLKERGQ